MSDHRPIRLSQRGIARSLRQRPIRQPPTLTPDSLAIALGYVIFRTRWRAGLTQAQVAAALGIHRSAVGRWEAGARVPTLPHLTWLGELTGRPASSMLAEAESLLRLAARDSSTPDGAAREGTGAGCHHRENDHAAAD